MIPLYFQFVNVQRRRRECTVSSDDTVQFTATKVFNSQRPRCSTSPPYSLKDCESEQHGMNEIESFVSGFKLAARIIIEVLQEPPKA